MSTSYQFNPTLERIYDGFISANVELPDLVDLKNFIAKAKRMMNPDGTVVRDRYGISLVSFLKAPQYGVHDQFQENDGNVAKVFSDLASLGSGVACVSAHNNLHMTIGAYVHADKRGGVPNTPITATERQTAIFKANNGLKAVVAGPIRVHFRGISLTPNGRVCMLGYPESEPGVELGDDPVNQLRQRLGLNVGASSFHVSLMTLVNPDQLDLRQLQALIEKYRRIRFGTLTVAETSLVEHDNDLLDCARLLISTPLSSAQNVRLASARKDLLGQAQDLVDFLGDRTRVQHGVVDVDSFSIADARNGVVPVIHAVGSPAPESFFNAADQWKTYSQILTQAGRQEVVPVVITNGRGRGYRRLIINTFRFIGERREQLSGEAQKEFDAKVRGFTEESQADLEQSKWKEPLGEAADKALFDNVLKPTYQAAWTEGPRAHGPNSLNEAKIIRFLFELNGVPDQVNRQPVFFLEEVSDNTLQNMRLGYQVLQTAVETRFPHAARVKIHVIADAFHRMRAVLQFKRDVIGEHGRKEQWEVTGESMYLPNLTTMNDDQVFFYVEQMIGNPDQPSPPFGEIGRLQHAFYQGDQPLENWFDAQPGSAFMVQYHQWKTGRAEHLRTVLFREYRDALDEGAEMILQALVSPSLAGLFTEGVRREARSFYRQGRPFGVEKIPDGQGGVMELKVVPLAPSSLDYDKWLESLKFLGGLDDAELNGKLPGRRDRKFDPVILNALPFEGVSVIHNTSPQEAKRMRLSTVANELKDRLTAAGGKLGRMVAFVGLDTFHATTFELINEPETRLQFEAQPGYRYENVRPEVERETLRFLESREGSYYNSLQVPVRVAAIGMFAPGIIKLNLEFLNERSRLIMEEFRARLHRHLQCALGAAYALVRTHLGNLSPHITIGYTMNSVSAREAEQFIAILRDINGRMAPGQPGELGVFQMTRGEVTPFSSMDKYKPLSAEKTDRQQDADAALHS
jgi:hypothetical protein